MEADKVGITLANAVGYAPTGLSQFLTRLADRNKDAKERSGVFASHPETKARIDGLASTIATSRLTATATVAPRYGESIKYTLVAVADVAQGPPPAPAAKSSGGGEDWSRQSDNARAREIGIANDGISGLARRQHRSRCKGRTKQGSDRCDGNTSRGRGVQTGDSLVPGPSSLVPIGMSDLSRRDLLKGAALVAAGSAFSPAIAENITAAEHPDLAPPAPLARATMKRVPFERHDTVRIGIVGTGLRGRSVLNELLAIEGVRITALCDVVPDKLARAAKMITDKGQPAPATIVKSDRGFEELVRRDDVDFVYTATPWEWHVPVMLAPWPPESTAGANAQSARRSRTCGRSSTHRRNHAGTACISRTATTATTRCSSTAWCTRAYSARSCTPRRRICMTCRSILFENERRRSVAARMAHARELQSVPHTRPRPGVAGISTFTPATATTISSHGRTAPRSRTASRDATVSTRQIQAGRRSTSPAITTRRSSKR